MAKQRPTVGDFVRTHLAGVWRIHRLLDVRGRDPATGRPAVRSLAFVSRFTTDAFKLAPDDRCCEISLCRALNKADSQKLAKFVEQHPDALASFDARTPAPLDAVYNVPIEAPPKNAQKRLVEQLAALGKLTEPGIHAWLDEQRLSTNSRDWTLQFVSPNHEVDAEGFLLYAFAGVQK